MDGFLKIQSLIEGRNYDRNQWFVGFQLRLDELVSILAARMEIASMVRSTEFNAELALS